MPAEGEQSAHDQCLDREATSSMGHIRTAETTRLSENAECRLQEKDCAVSNCLAVGRTIYFLA